MKILLVHPKINPDHEWVGKLKGQGHAVLTSDQEKEAWQILQLHAESIDLVIVHREGLNGKGEPGLELVKKFKRTQEFSDLPYILTSEFMDASDFGQHQRTPLGANAYLRAPFTTEALLKLVQEVLPSEKTMVSPVPPPASKPPSTDGLTRVLVGAQTKILNSPTSTTPAVPPKPTSQRSESGAIVIEEASFTPSHTKGLTPSIRLDVDELTQPSMPEVPMATPEAVVSIEAAVPESAPIESATPDVIVVGEEPALDIGLGDPVSPILDPMSTVQLPNDASESLDTPFDASVEEPALDLSPDTGSLGRFSGASVPEPEVDLDALEAMPYVFGARGDAQKTPTHPISVPPSHHYTQPVDDSIVPGGASGNADLETLKKYLLFREQDVAVLSNQLKETRQQLEEVNQLLRLERAMATELKHTVDEQKRRIDGFETERRVLLEGFARETDELRFQIKGKQDKTRLLEAQVKEAVEEVERIKERVRLDIRKIRTREKELENRLEINRRDSEALLALRESRIVELKRKLDLLEFNMDLLQNQFEREKTNNKKLRELFDRASQVVKVAGGLLQVNDPSSESNPASSTGEGHGSSQAAS